jgi:integrase
MYLGADPIKDQKMIKIISDAIKILHGELYHDIFNTGINLGLRGQNLLNIKFDDIDFSKRRLVVFEKNQKWREVRLNEKVMNIFYKRRESFQNYIYIFENRSGNNYRTHKPITIQSLNKVLRDVGNDYGLKLSSHSLRKTFGCAMYRNNKPIELISKIFNHSCIKETLLYIGMTKQDVLQSYDDVIV